MSREVGLKTIRLNEEQRAWVLEYLHCSKDYDTDDPFCQLLKALLEQPYVTDVRIREDQNIVRLMFKAMR